MEILRKTTLIILPNLRNVSVFFTNNQIEPPASLDNLLHSVLVSGGDAKPDDEDDDVVQIIAEVHEHWEEPQATIGKCRSEECFDYSNQDTRH